MSPHSQPRRGSPKSRVRSGYSIESIPLLPSLPPAGPGAEQGASPVALKYANSLRVNVRAQPTSAGFMKHRWAELLLTTPMAGASGALRSARGGRDASLERAGGAVRGGECPPARGADAGRGCGAGVRGRDTASILTLPERRYRLQKAGRRSIASLNPGLEGWDPPPGPPNCSSGSPAFSSLALS